MSAITAIYESRCAECSAVIRVGDPIVPSDLDDARPADFKPWWQHESCPPGRLDIVREVCAECFTEKSVDGSCLCGAM
ncbi:hypothetical protein [Microbacterium sp. 2FI]|uniref:hypothetical protein n=1 Tax=Microbacterium sp. 2FI TaxID=2502193 RepID=UPI0010F6A733|nr:hypothetical protein [Microbacterium sp. 2FI]